MQRELSHKAKLVIYWSIHVPTLPYGHDLRVMTERRRSRIAEAELSGVVLLSFSEEPIAETVNVTLEQQRLQSSELVQVTQSLANLVENEQ